MLIAEKAVNRANQIQDNGIAIIVLDGLLERCIRPNGLCCDHEQPSQIRPCRAMVFLPLRDRAKRTDGHPVLSQFERNETDKEVRLDETRLRTPQPPAG